MYSDDVIERFWAQVDRSGGPDADWPWLGAVHANGYGVFNLGARQELAHRVALELSGVEIPAGFVVIRTCSNRLCCNPAHLRAVARTNEMATRRSRLRRLPKPEKKPESDEN